MILRVYAVFDMKSKTFNTPFFLINDDVAKRAFFDLVNDPNTTVARHPEDFSLWCLGSWEDVQGEFAVTEESNRAVLVDALSLVKKNED